MLHHLQSSLRDDDTQETLLAFYKHLVAALNKQSILSNKVCFLSSYPHNAGVFIFLFYFFINCVG
jgi:hypothetical protein